MLLRIGQFGIVLAIGFAIGTFFGRENPSDSGVARWFKAQPGTEQALEDLGRSVDELGNLFEMFASPTPTPR